jgi:hypothetical protein
MLDMLGSIEVTTLIGLELLIGISVELGLAEVFAFLWLDLQGVVSIVSIISIIQFQSSQRIAYSWFLAKVADRLMMNEVMRAVVLIVVPYVRLAVSIPSIVSSS